LEILGTEFWTEFWGQNTKLFVNQGTPDASCYALKRLQGKVGASYTYMWDIETGGENASMCM